MSTRERVIAHLADLIEGVRPRQRAIIAIDGVDGAGKTWLADELRDALAARREVHRVSIDGFHRPREQRYARGRTPETFYEDSYDYAAFAQRCIEPFRAGEPFVTQVWEVTTDTPVVAEPVVAGTAAVLIVDGIFLHRPELRAVWDASAWLEVPFGASVPRGNARFGPLTPDLIDPESATNQRYVQGQRRYLAQAKPAAYATWVIDNADLNHPRLKG